MFLPFILIIGFCCKIIQYGSNAIFMIVLFIYYALTMRENFRVADNKSPSWELCAGKYMEYELLDSCTNVSTEIHTPPHSSSSTLNTPSVVKFKIKPGIHTVIDDLDSYDDDEPPVSTPIFKPSPSSLNSPSCTPWIFMSYCCTPSQTLHFHSSMSTYFGFYAL